MLKGEGLQGYLRLHLGHLPVSERPHSFVYVLGIVPFISCVELALHCLHFLDFDKINISPFVAESLVIY